MATPTLSVHYSTDPVDDASPTWIDVTTYVRSFSTSRGRENQLSRVDPGTATIVLNNRTRMFDPNANTSLRPMNRWRIRGVLPNATTEHVFLGYAESYDLNWPGVGVDAVTIVRCVDEFKVLAQDHLPATDPPKDTYRDLVLYDQPAAYWGMDNIASSFAQDPIVGPQLNYDTTAGSGAVASLYAGAIVGGEIPGQANSMILYAGTPYLTLQFEAGTGGDVTGLSEMAVEGWFKTADVTDTVTIIQGPLGGGNIRPYQLYLSGSQIGFQVKNDSSTSYTVTSGTLTNNTWYHVVGTITGGSVRIYINGVEVSSTPFVTPLPTPLDGTGANIQLGNTGSSADMQYDEVAIYRYGLSAARILAHYTAGTARGFPNDDLPGPRITRALTTSGSVAATSIRPGNREMVGSYMRGQPVLEEIRRAETVENVDAVFFIARDGTVTFLDDGHRSVAPWSSVKATFDDDGTDLPYQDIQFDYSDSFVANEWNVNRVGGTTTTVSDATSASYYGPRPQSLSDLSIRDDADVTTIADSMLAKYKDRMRRVTSLACVLSGNTISNTVPTLEIGDRIRVFRSPSRSSELYPSTTLYPETTVWPDAGRIDQTLFVQKIEVSGTPGVPWTVRLGVSPL